MQWLSCTCYNVSSFLVLQTARDRRSCYGPRSWCRAVSRGLFYCPVYVVMFHRFLCYRQQETGGVVTDHAAGVQQSAGNYFMQWLSCTCCNVSSFHVLQTARARRSCYGPPSWCTAVSRGRWYPSYVSHGSCMDSVLMSLVLNNQLDGKCSAC